MTMKRSDTAYAKLRERVNTNDKQPITNNNHKTSLQ